MMKSNLVFLGYYALVGALHFLISKLLPEHYFTKDIILAYLVMIISNVVGNTLFWRASKSEEPAAFASMFLIFTTIQMLAVLSFVAFITQSDRAEEYSTVIQTLILFFLTLIFQTYYILKTSKRRKKSA